MNQHRKPLIIYIIGRGHSGSTLLDLLLGSHPAIAGLGELKWLSEKKKSKKKARNERCACGAPSTASCQFWKSIDAKLQTMHNLKLEELDLRSTNQSKLASHNLALFESIQGTTGTRYLVDSSKSHERLNQLRSLGDAIELYPVYIVRNPCGVIFSHIRRGRGLKHWARKYRSNCHEIHSTLSGQRFHILEYEQLTSEPEKVLASLASYIGLDEQAHTLFGQKTVQHNIGGNTMRLKDSPEVAPDFKWKTELSLWQKITIKWYTKGYHLELRKLRREAMTSANQPHGR